MTDKHPFFTEDQIRAKAYEIWQARNDDKSDVENWNAAIEALNKERMHPIFKGIQAIWNWKGMQAIWNWTGIREKKGLDLLQIILLPLILALMTASFQNCTKQREEGLAADKARQESYSRYIDQMSDLLINKALGIAKPHAEVFILAQSRTAMALRELDPKKQDLLLRFIQSVDLYNPQTRSGLLQNAYLRSINLSNADLRQINLSNADLGEANLENDNLSNANLSNANFRNANLSNTKLTSANLSGTETNLIEANLIKANLIGANLIQANLKEANLIKANLFNANLSESKLRFTDFRHARLDWATFSNTNLSEANLEKASLVSANLKQANLEKANLEGADLFGADLEKTNLKQANLRNVNLEKTINLTPETTHTACFWEEARLDESLRKKVEALTPIEVDCRIWIKQYF
jgi:BTB/POZ domain-containing protein KCTD9